MHSVRDIGAHFVHYCLRALVQIVLTSRAGMKNWFVSVVYHSDNGDVDVDFAVDEIEEVYTALSQGPGIKAIRTIKVERMTEELQTIQQLAAALKHNEF